VPNDLTGPIWERRFSHTFAGTFVDGHEWFFLANVEASQVSDVAETGEGARYFEGWRWWTLDEIRAYDGIVAPRRLADLLTPVLEGTVPSMPIVTGE
jgi:hypothetical protein